MITLWLCVSEVSCEKPLVTCLAVWVTCSTLAVRGTANQPRTKHTFFLNFFFLYSRFLLVIYFIHISVYMSIPISLFIPHPRFSPLVPIRLFSTSVSLFLPCKLVHLYHFSRFHIYALIYDIRFFLSDLLHSVCQYLGPSRLYK